MNLQWNKIILHNFGSYKHAEVDLLNRGYCLVSGQNLYKKDNALSNGSGKSFLWSALCYTITGETIQGLTKNLKNINVENDNTGYTAVDLDVDSDHYLITRFFAPKSNLTIIKNDKDISGKTFTESCKVLSNNLPDLTKELIASTSILGQGLPTKFSSYKPSGRKELLEKLTKSDFMIEDIKSRITNRLLTLNNELRTYEDSLLILNTSINNNTRELEKVIQEKQNYKPKNFEEEIKKLSQEIENLKNDKIEYLNNYNLYLGEENKATADLVNFTNNLQTAVQKCQADYDSHLDTLYADQQEIQINLNTLKAEISSLSSEIKKLKQITDICPTCGQKLQGVEKPSTVEQEKQLNSKKILLESFTVKKDNLVKNINSIKIEKNDKIAKVNNSYAASLNSIKEQLASFKHYKEEANININKTDLSIQGKNSEIEKLNYEKNMINNYLNNLETKINTLKTSIDKDKLSYTITNNAKLKLNDHIEIVKKMETLAKRDFRGYLLSNIIDYLNNKAKEYSQIVFGTDELNIYLDGNDLNISYCNKLLDNLSGGERQRVDLIIQFALRDLLSKQSNYSSNILVLDEIFDNLDYIATENILKLITTKLTDIESIFIISHHADELEINYDSELKILKNEAGISEIVY